MVLSASMEPITQVLLSQTSSKLGSGWSKTNPNIEFLYQIHVSSTAKFTIWYVRFEQLQLVS